MSWRLDPQQTALLVIDVQERLIPAMSEPDALVRKVVHSIQVARLFDVPVFHTEQAPAKIGRTVAPVLAALGENAAPVRLKNALSAANVFGPRDLPPTLLIAGIETHVCVRQTVFDLHARGHSIYLLADAVSSRSLTDHRMAVHEMREHAAKRVTTVEAVAWELLGSAEGETFKHLLAILK